MQRVQGATQVDQKVESLGQVAGGSGSKQLPQLQQQEQQQQQRQKQQVVTKLGWSLQRWLG